MDREFSIPNVTRGEGLLEKLLAIKRAKQADKLIPSSYRKGRILDIGCGAYPLFLSEVKFFDKYGVDKNIDEKLTFYFKRKGVTLINYDIEKEKVLPFKDEYFNVVTMLAILEHLEYHCLEKVLSEIYRVLTIGGMLIITTPSTWTDKLLKFMAKVNLVSRVEIGEHKDTYNFFKVVCLLQRANFSEEKIRFGYFEFYMNQWITAMK